MKTAADIAEELIDRIEICAVDGGQARQQDQSFSVGGHHYVYPWIPENKIYIEKGNSGKDLSALIGHEVTERDMMKRQGFTYDQAHPIANHVEEAVRLDDGKQDGDTQSEEGAVNNKKTAADLVAQIGQRLYESEKGAEELRGVARALRLGGDLVEEGADQYMRYRIRKKNEEKYKLEEQHQSLPKVAAGANFPPISGPTSTSGITTSSQHEEKLKRCPPIPKPEAQPLGTWDIDKVSSLIDSLVPKVAGFNPATPEDPQELYHKAVGADRRHKILSSTLSSALSSGITSPIFLKQMGLSGGNLAKASLGLTGISALLGAATGGVSGMLSSRRSMKSIYDAQGMKGLHDQIKRHGLAESALAGGVGGLVGAGTSLLLRDRIPAPFQAAESPALQSFGRAVPTVGEIAGGLGTSMGATYAVDKIIDAMHNKQGNYYDQFPHNPETPEVPADRYSTGRQGLLYASSALHPFMSAPLAAATAHPGERFDQFGRALFGGLAGDVVGGLAGSFALGPEGFLLGSLLGRPVGTYITQHVG